MAYNIRIVSTYPPRRCGIGTFSRDLAGALSHFTAEVGHIRVAAIDKDRTRYDIPVDLVIDQYDPKSWVDVTSKIIVRVKTAGNPTVVLLQHEYGLDPDEQGRDARGNNFVTMTRALRQDGLTTLVYLHTVLENPNDFQKKTIQDLAQYSEGLVVTTESAIDILESEVYGIAHAKLKHIDHGIRMQHPSQYDRLMIKQQLGLQDRFLLTTLGFISPGKGIQYSLEAYAKFLHESCTDDQRDRLVYLIAGRFHPEFVKFADGKHYRQYEQTLARILDESKLRWCRVNELGKADCAKYDVIFLDCFMDDNFLMKLYGATNVMILPYLNTEQISSGVLADTLGSGRVAIATKFRYALELIHSNRRCPEGLVIGRHVRGILVDPAEPSVEQIAQALDYLVFNKGKRLRMEKQAHQRGYQMRWNNTAWALLQYIDFIREEHQIVTGRGITFTRQRDSALSKSGSRSKTVDSTADKVGKS